MKTLFSDSGQRRYKALITEKKEVIIDQTFYLEIQFLFVPGGYISKPPSYV